jgi:hypothetical protein
MDFEVFHESGKNLLPCSFGGVILRHPEAAQQHPADAALPSFRQPITNSASCVMLEFY